MQIFFVVSTIFAIGGGLGWGLVSDRWGHKKTLCLVLVIFLVATIVTVLAPAKSAFWFIGPLIGITLAGIWTCDRPLLIALSPPEQYGTFFGVYSFAGKLAAILGPLQWGLVVDICAAFGPWRYRIAIGSLVLFFGAGLLILSKVKVPRR